MSSTNNVLYKREQIEIGGQQKPKIVSVFNHILFKKNELSRMVSVRFYKWRCVRRMNMIKGLWNAVYATLLGWEEDFSTIMNSVTVI